METKLAGKQIYGKYTASEKDWPLPNLFRGVYTRLKEVGFPARSTAEQNHFVVGTTLLSFQVVERVLEAAQDCYVFGRHHLLSYYLITR